MLTATGEDRPSAEHVGAKKINVTPPHTDFRGDVENRVHSAAGGAHRRLVVERGADETHAPRLQVRRGRARQHGDGAALREQTPNEPAPEKSGATGDQRRGVVE